MLDTPAIANSKTPLSNIEGTRVSVSLRVLALRDRTKKKKEINKEIREKKRDSGEIKKKKVLISFSSIPNPLEVHIDEYNLNDPISYLLANLTLMHDFFNSLVFLKSKLFYWTGG